MLAPSSPCLNCLALTASTFCCSPFDSRGPKGHSPENFPAGRKPQTCTAGLNYLATHQLCSTKDLCSCGRFPKPAVRGLHWAYLHCHIGVITNHCLPAPRSNHKDIILAHHCLFPVNTYLARKLPLPPSLLDHRHHLIIPEQTHSPSASLHDCLPNTSSHPHTSIMTNVVCPGSSLPSPSSALFHKAPTKINFMLSAYPRIPIMPDSSRTSAVFATSPLTPPRQRRSPLFCAY